MLRRAVAFELEASGEQCRHQAAREHADIVRDVRQVGAGLRMISDGDITAAVAPSLPESGVDLYVGAGGSPEAVLAAAALKCLGGDMQVRMWLHDEAHRALVTSQVAPEDLQRVFHVNDLVVGESSLFCATGISDSALLPGINRTGHRAETHSVLMRARSRTVRHIRTGEMLTVPAGRQAAFRAGEHLKHAVSLAPRRRGRRPSAAADAA